MKWPWPLGQKVKLELSPAGGARWQWNNLGVLIDKGYTGKFITGTFMSETTGGIANFHMEHEGHIYNFQIAVEGHPWYNKTQWDLPGFMSPVFADKPAPICSCGSWSTYGKGKGGGLHDWYCDVAKQQNGTN